MIEKYAVRLEGLNWKWIRADRLGLSPRDLVRFGQALSKDAPDILALALDMSDVMSLFVSPGYLFVNADLEAITCYAEEIWMRVKWGEREYRHFLFDLAAIYVPLGFALDIEQWRSEQGVLPICSCLSSRRETESYLNPCSSAGCRLNGPMTYHANCGSQERIWCADCGTKLSDSADEPIEMKSVEYICQQCVADGIQPGHFACGTSFNIPIEGG